MRRNVLIAEGKIKEICQFSFEAIVSHVGELFGNSSNQLVS